MKLYDCNDVANMLGKSRVTIRENARKHKIGQFVAGAWIFTDEDIKALRQLPGRGRPKSKKELPDAHTA